MAIEFEQFGEWPTGMGGQCDTGAARLKGTQDKKSW